MSSIAVKFACAWVMGEWLLRLPSGVRKLSCPYDMKSPAIDDFLGFQGRHGLYALADFPFIVGKFA